MKDDPSPLPNEAWKPIEGFPDYQVSNLGRIISHRQNKPFLKRPVKDKRGYCRITLAAIPGKPVTKYVHLLVAAAFLPHPSPTQEIDHINGNPSDNTTQNLRWCSHKENINHAIARRGNWFPRKQRNSPIYQITSPTTAILHPSLADACASLGKPQSASSNLLHSCNNLNRSYGFLWSRIEPHNCSVTIASSLADRLIPPLISPPSSDHQPAQTPDFPTRTREPSCLAATHSNGIRAL